MNDRWIDRVPDAPGGLISAWVNALVCGFFVIAAPIGVFTSTEAPGNIFFAIFALLITGTLETTFVYKLLQQMKAKNK